LGPKMALARAQKSLEFRAHLDFFGPTPITGPRNAYFPPEIHYFPLHKKHRCINSYYTSDSRLIAGKLGSFGLPILPPPSRPSGNIQNCTDFCICYMHIQLDFILISAEQILAGFAANLQMYPIVCHKIMHLIPLLQVFFLRGNYTTSN
jgi:hypothetical protein